MPYVDGYVMPISKSKVDAYRKMARKASKIWRDNGALEYRECVGDDLKAKWGTSFPKALKLKPSETVIFAWVVYRSKAHRDRVNAKVMKDPRMAAFDPSTMPFDPKRMSYGGFKVIVAA